MERPYYAGKEVSGAYFFNRKKELKQLFNALKEKQAVNIAIIGERRIGKTSLIKKVATMLEKNKQILCVLIKCEKLLPIDPLTFFQNLIKELIKLPELSKERFKEKARKIAKQLKLGFAAKDIEFWIELGKGKVDLKEVMDKCFSIINNLSKRTKVIIFLDEFHELFKFGDQFLWALRAYISDSKASFVVTSSHHRFLEKLQEKKQPFFNFFEIIRLKGVERKEALSYLKKRIKRYGLIYKKEILQNILEDSKLNPYYIQLLGLKCYENAIFEKKKIIDMQTYKSAFKDCLDNLPAYLLNNYSKLRGKTKDVFIALCLYDLKRPSKIAEKVRLSTSNVSQILRQISETYGLVKKQGRDYVVIDKFLQEYVKREAL